MCPVLVPGAWSAAGAKCSSTFHCHLIHTRTKTVRIHRGLAGTKPLLSILWLKKL